MDAHQGINDAKRQRESHDDTRDVTTQTLEIPSTKVGLIIGRGGETIRELQSRTSCRIQTPTRQQQQQNTAVITFQGGNIAEAMLLVKRLISGKTLRARFVRSHVVPPPSKLYVDILNFVDSHFFVDVDDWSLGPVLERVRSFVDAAKSSGTASIVVFIDAVRTEEALDKWHDRMSRSTREGKRNVPQNISGIMAEMCLRAGVAEVRLSTEVNNDDTLASHAFHDQVAILSGDRDFLRYVCDDQLTPAQLTIFSDFQVTEDHGLALMKRDEPPLIREVEKTRRIIRDPPKYHRHGVDAGDAWVHDLARKRSFRGGAPSPLVRALGFNPYVTLRPLRICLYQQLLLLPSSGGEHEQIRIREEFPIWDPLSDRAVFPVEMVVVEPPQDSAMIQLAKHPRKAFEFFFPRESREKSPPSGVNCSAGDWYRHCHGCKVIVIELCCYFPTPHQEEVMNFFDVLKESEDW